MKTIQVFTLAELKDSHPSAFARVLERWAEMVATDSDPAWQAETMDSFKAVVSACGGRLADWSIGAYSPCSATVWGIDDDEQDREWFRANVLTPNGYKLAEPDGYERKWYASVEAGNRIDFPGNCPFTGYCADEDMLEHVWVRLCKGDTLTESLESCADVAGKMMEDDVEQQQDEESMMANWGENTYTADGVEV